MSKKDVMMQLQFLTDAELRKIIFRCNDLLGKRNLLASVSEQVEAAVEAPKQTCSDEG